MANGRCESGGSLNLIMYWSSTQNSITVDLYLYNQYRISASTAKDCSIHIAWDANYFSYIFGNVSAGSETYLGSYTLSGLSAGSSYSLEGVLDIKITYAGSYVETLNVYGTAYTEEEQTARFLNNYINVRFLDAVDIYYILDKEINTMQYSLNGAAWHDVKTIAGNWKKEARIIVENLNPNSSYNVRLKATYRK